MVTATGSDTGSTETTFSEVLGENAPYIAALYLLNVVLMAAFVDHSALLEGQLTYQPIVGEAGSTELFTQVIAASLAGVFVIVTLIGVLFAVSLANERRRSGLDEYDLEERISTISIVPAMQLFAIILTPILTSNTIVDGIQYLAAGLAAFL